MLNETNYTTNELLCEEVYVLVDIFVMSPALFGAIIVPSSGRSSSLRCLSTHVRWVVRYSMIYTALYATHNHSFRRWSIWWLRGGYQAPVSVT